MRPIKRLAPRSPTLQMSRVMYLNYDPDLSRADLFREHRAFGAAFRDAVAPLAPPDACPRDPQRRLRIGYLSPDFRTHSVAYFVAPIFQAFDRERFETIGYAHVTKPDHITEHLREPGERVARRQRARRCRARAPDPRRPDRHPGRARRLHQGQPPARVHRAGPRRSRSATSATRTRPACRRSTTASPITRPTRTTADDFYAETLIRLPRCFLAFAAPRACAGGRAAAGPAQRPRDLRLVQQPGQGQRQGGRAVGRGAARGAAIAPAAQGRRAAAIRPPSAICAARSRPPASTPSGSSSLRLRRHGARPSRGLSRGRRGARHLPLQRHHDHLRGAVDGRARGHARRRPPRRAGRRQPARRGRLPGRASPSGPQTTSRPRVCWPSSASCWRRCAPICAPTWRARRLCDAAGHARALEEAYRAVWHIWCAEHAQLADPRQAAPFRID